jgi:hypothetical protein
VSDVASPSVGGTNLRKDRTSVTCGEEGGQKSVEIQLYRVFI